MDDRELKDLLGDLEGEARDARLRLLRELRDDGCTLDELRAAIAEDRLALLQVDRVLAGERTLTYRELSERTGVPLEVLHEARAAFGLPPVADDERRWDEQDVEAVEGMRMLLDGGVPVERVLELNRVVGRAMAQVAAAARGMVAEALLRPGATEREVSAGLAAAARELVPRMTPTLAYVFEAHLRELVRSDVISAADIAAGRTPGARDLAVAFADLVGFTRMGEQVPPEEVGEIVRRLESRAAAIVEPPVTLVKTIGDAVMLVSPQVDPLLEAGCRLVEGDGDEPPLRVGVAYGTAVERAGDWYGSPVNQASRVTALARPGTVLATEAVRERARGRWTWSFARQRRLRGVGEVKLFRARPPGAQPPRSGARTRS